MGWKELASAVEASPQVCGMMCGSCCATRAPIHPIHRIRIIDLQCCALLCGVVGTSLLRMWRPRRDKGDSVKPISSAYHAQCCVRLSSWVCCQ